MNRSTASSVDEKLYSTQALYQLNAFSFARARAAYDSLHANVRGQFLLGWTPVPGTSLYAGYTDDLVREDGGLLRNGRTVFLKASRRAGTEAPSLKGADSNLLTGGNMKRKIRKLQLSKDTIVHLDNPSLKLGPVGGYYTPETYCCPSMTGETQCYCPIIDRK